MRPVALPVEHGGWGLLFEPIVLGLLLAPSLAGLFLSVGAVGVFLSRHPFKLAIGDWRRGRRIPRTALAERFAILYVCLATIGLIIAIKTAGVAFVLPLLLAAPFTIVQLFYDSLGRSRSLIAELAGSISIGAVAAAIAIAGGWPRPLAFALWVILAARTVPTILYLRARLRLLHHKPASPRVVIVMHVLAILIVFGLALMGLAPFLAVAALVILLARAVIGFSGAGNRVTPKKLGLRELGFGLMTVGAVVVGHFVGW
jgi:hypothetical protein